MKKDQWSGLEEWKQNRESMPTVGGIVVGGPPSSGKLKATGPAVFTSDAGRWQLEVDTTAGHVVFAEATNSELALAHALVLADASALATCESSGIVGEVTTCGVTPAIADTALAYDAQQLDAMIPLGGGKLVIQPDTVLVVPSETTTVVWSDEPARISAQAGHLVVRAQTTPESVLMRIRFIVRRKVTANQLKSANAELDRILEIKDTAAIVLNQPYNENAVISEFEFRKLKRDAGAATNRFNAKIEALWKMSDSLQAIDRFARVRAVLFWLKQQGMLPTTLPSSLVARKFRVPSVFTFEPPAGILITR